jgi:hypothetical protein
MMFEDQGGLRKVFDLQSPHQMLEKLRWENDLVCTMLGRALINLSQRLLRSNTNRFVQSQ